jgi:hypothetical protein
MLTDEDLTSQLKVAFDDATHDLAPASGLGAVVHRRHRAARRRAVAMRIAVPAAAACAGGVAVVGSGSSPSSHAPTTHHPTALASGRSGGHAKIRTVAYVVKVPDRTGPTFACLADGAVPQPSDDTDVWYVAGPDQCMTLVVDLHVTLPADAQPIELAGVAGLYGTTDAGTDSRTIYSRNPGGDGWTSLVVAADTPDDVLRAFYTQAN